MRAFGSILLLLLLLYAILVGLLSFIVLPIFIDHVSRVLVSMNQPVSIVPVAAVPLLLAIVVAIVVLLVHLLLLPLRAGPLSPSLIIIVSSPIPLRRAALQLPPFLEFIETTVVIILELFGRAPRLHIQPCLVLHIRLPIPLCLSVGDHVLKMRGLLLVEIVLLEEVVTILGGHSLKVIIVHLLKIRLLALLLLLQLLLLLLLLLVTV